MSTSTMFRRATPFLGQRPTIILSILQPNRPLSRVSGKQMSTRRRPDTITYVNPGDYAESYTYEDEQSLLSARLRKRLPKKISENLASLEGEKEIAEEGMIRRFHRRNRAQIRRTIENQEAAYAEMGVEGEQEGDSRDQWQDVDNLRPRRSRTGDPSGRQRARTVTQPNHQRSPPTSRDSPEAFSVASEAGGMKRPDASLRTRLGPRRARRTGTSLYDDKEDEDPRNNARTSEDISLNLDPEEMRLVRQMSAWRNPVMPEEPGKPALYQTVKTGYDIFAEERTEFRLNDYSATVTVNGPTTTPDFSLGGVGGDYDLLLPENVQKLASIDSATHSPVDAIRFTLALTQGIDPQQRDAIVATVQGVVSRGQGRKSQAHTV